MTMQVPDPQQNRRQRRNRLILTSLTIVFLVGVAVIWIVNIGNALSGVLSIIFTLLGILLAFLQRRPQPRLESQILTGGMSAGEQGQQHFHKQIEGVTLEVDRRKGALVVYTRRDLRGSTINLSFGFHDGNLKADLAASVIGRKQKGSIVYVAVFPSLDAGNYTIHTDSREFMTKVSIMPGRVEEVDWR